MIKPGSSQDVPLCPNSKPKRDDCRDNASHDQNRILSLMELFYFSYRDFTTDGDEVLEKIGYGRAHHRVLHFVHHYPGLRVADLLNILKITKQSLARVLKQLVDEDYISQKPGPKDRRERLLYTTAKGQELFDQLAEPQIERFINALAPLTKAEQKTIETFLFSLIEKKHRHEVITLMSDVETGDRDRDDIEYNMGDSKIDQNPNTLTEEEA